MKYALILILPLFILYGPSDAQCLNVPSFKDACTTTNNFCDHCPTWADNCGGGWIRSHGTPEMQPYCTTISGKPYCSSNAYMWSISTPSGNIGEGMFANITGGNFLANHAYEIKLRVQTTVQATGGSGTINVYATNTLIQSSLDGNQCCGTAIPSIPGNQKQLIGTYSGVTNQWIDLPPMVFIPKIDYSQIWIYPTANSRIQYNLYVMTVQACASCEGTIIYNNGTIPANLSKAGTISAGSTVGSGGFGTVTVQPTLTTSFFANNQINLLPSFAATVTSGSFSATVDYCSVANPERVMPDSLTWAQLDSIDVPVTPADEGGSAGMRTITKIANNEKSDSILATMTEQMKVIQLYPSLGTGTIHIDGNKQDLDNALITIFDQLGRQVYKKRNTSGETTQRINLEYLNNGLYYVQIQNLTGTIIKKIIINK